MNRWIVAVVTSCFVLGASAAPRHDGAIQEMTQKQELSIAKALTWLRRNQNPDGLWGCEKSGAPSTAITALSILAFLASGSTPSDGPDADLITKAIEKLISIQSASGQITRYDSTGMGIFYDHSCATLALAEVYGTRRHDEFNGLRESLVKAVAFMYTVQNEDGGWGPQGGRSPSDLAITCSVWMALRAAHNAGIAIRGASVEKVQEFVKKCAAPKRGYDLAPTVRGGGGGMFYPTSAGLRILCGMGKGNLKEVESAMEVLLDRKMGQDYGGQISEWDYCGAFFAVQAMMHEGDTFWKKWWPKFRDHLVEIQNPDGSWTIQYCLCCRAYATALSVIVLQAPKRLLPVFQL